MELKLTSLVFSFFDTAYFNRTNMELKLTIRHRQSFTVRHFNRTNMELKLTFFPYNAKNQRILIAPIWN